ncbi:MAG TPA: hypothetical protein VNZ94_00505 [Xanthobacteraceae bacterium]|nr:hypothetical protein [Xanthobacteraceae bacterium]
MTFLNAQPPGEDGLSANLYQRTEAAATGPIPHEQSSDETGPNWLTLVAQAETQGGRFITDQVKSAWGRSYKAFHNQHFAQSKYLSQDYRSRSKLFRPKTRSAVRKANAGAASALFSTRDTVSCSAGNEDDPNQRASAALIQELLNYRTDRTSGRAAIPWFRVAIGAHQDTLIMSACLSKQYWKLDLEAETTEEPLLDEIGQPVLGEDGEPIMQEVKVYKPSVDRPDVLLCPLENVIIDPAASWLDPVQSASYFIVKYPMRIDEIRQKQRDPRNPWLEVEESVMRGAGADEGRTASGTRAARDRGLDRMDAAATGAGDFEVIWVYEVFMRLQGQDICFWSAGSKAYLTEPRPVKDVYPEFGGERPYVLGTGTLESHRIFPMAPVESWQQVQQEINDLANLRLDQVKQGVSPITFVKRGRQVDLGALQRRGPGTTILRTERDDIEFDRPPEVPSSAYAEMERLNVDFDDLAGQFNSGSVQTNRSLNETVGGLNLISSSANAVQEFDLRTWTETWVEPVLGQIVKLIQFYESDEVILGLCGDRAQLLQKFHINQITDDLLQQQITVRVDVGLGASNPQTKIQNFAMAMQIAQPIWAASPQVQSGELMPDLEEINAEIFSLAGYRDGGRRFIKKGQPKGPPPEQQALVEKIRSEAMRNASQAELNKARASESSAKVQMGYAGMVHGQQMDRAKLVQQVRSEREGWQRDDRWNAAQAPVNPQEVIEPPSAAMPEQEEVPEQDILSQLMALLSRERRVQFIRDPNTGRIVEAVEIPTEPR